jgi:hypothetical protein
VRLDLRQTDWKRELAVDMSLWFSFLFCVCEFPFFSFFGRSGSEVSTTEPEILRCVERRRGLAVVSKVSETETKTKISEAAEATESTEELQETLNSALKSVQEAVSFFFFFFPSPDWQGIFVHVPMSSLIILQSRSCF